MKVPLPDLITDMSAESLAEIKDRLVAYNVIEFTVEDGEVVAYGV